MNLIDEMKASHEDLTPMKIGKSSYSVKNKEDRVSLGKRGTHDPLEKPEEGLILNRLSPQQPKKANKSRSLNF
jgi:hypothetical protein